MRKKEENLNTASGLRIAMILLGIAVTPVLLSSSSLGNQLSSGSLISVVLLGGVILTLLSAITISVGEKARLPTYGIVKYSFGEKGAIAINILMAISLFGWIAVTANMFGHSVHDLLAQHGLEVPLALLVAAGCVIFVASTAFGFAVLGKIAQVAVPVIALVLCYILYVATHTEVAVPAAIVEMNTGVAVSTVVGTIIVLVATLLTRFPKWQITVALGILSAIVGSMDIMAWFIPFLLFLGIATPPVAGIYIADFFLYRRNGYQESVLAQESQIKVLTFAAWIIGAAVGFMTVKGLFTLTTIPSVDSILVACIAYAILSRASQHR
ncbi:TPA: cytosine permease [Escherichia coli]